MSYRKRARRNTLSSVNSISTRDGAQKGQWLKITFDGVAALAGIKRRYWRHMGVVLLGKFICRAFIYLKP